MNQVNPGRDVRQVQRLFHRSVAAAHDAADLVTVKKAVAGGAAGYAAPLEGGFRRQPQVLGRCARGDDQAVAGVDAAVAGQGERALRQVHGVDVVEDDFGVEPLRMLQEALHQLGPLDAVHVGWPIVDFGGRHQLAALGHSSDQHRFEVGAGSVDGGGIAGRA